jgi:PAS domain S-box-containing protein
MAYEDSFAYKLLQKFESMRERVQNYVSVVDLCPLPAFITSREGTAILYVNDAYRRLIGKTEEQLQNDDWLSVIHPEDREEAKQAWIALVANPKDGVPLVHRHRYLNNATGTIIPAVTYTTPVLNNGIVGYIVPADCSGLLYLGVDLGCPTQKEKLAAKAGNDPATPRLTAGRSTS